MKAAVYWNIHKAKWSVAEYKSPRVYGRILRYEDTILMNECRAVVREGGRQRVIREKRKNVHAWVTGELFCVGLGRPPNWTSIVTYNPYRAGHFHPVWRTDEPLEELGVVFFSKDGKLYRMGDIKRAEYKHFKIPPVTTESDNQERMKRAAKHCT